MKLDWANYSESQAENGEYANETGLQRGQTGWQEFPELICIRLWIEHILWVNWATGSGRPALPDGSKMPPGKM